MITILLWSLLSQQGLHTEVYTPVLKNFLAVTADGRMMVLDIRSQEIAIFQQRKRMTTFGGQGEGPGKLRRPSAIQIEENHLFVFDLDHIHQFTIDGQHLQTWRKADKSLFTRRAQNTWFSYTSYLMSGDSIELFSSRDLREAGDPFFALKNSARPPKTYRLVQDHPIVLLDWTGRFAIAAERNHFAIHIFDLTTLKKVHTVKKQAPALPMDQVWAKQQIRQLQEKDPLPATMRAHVPKVFPYFRDILVSPENHLWIQTWSPNPRNPGFLVFDLKGQATTSAVKTYEGAKRILAIHRDKAIISTFEDEEALIYTIPFNQVDTFVAQHPIQFDWFTFLDSLHPK